MTDWWIDNWLINCGKNFMIRLFFLRALSRETNPSHVIKRNKIFFKKSHTKFLWKKVENYFLVTMKSKGCNKTVKIYNSTIVEYKNKRKEGKVFSRRRYWGPGKKRFSIENIWYKSLTQIYFSLQMHVDWRL